MPPVFHALHPALDCASVRAIRLRQVPVQGDVRSAAAQALGNFDEPRVKSALETARSEEKDEFVQVFIKMALNQLSAKTD
ncbi:MAG: hypothetical protein IPK13_10070 [Deltaproteobacteria bacterium]|nr:hypothetical protein [Deltaproteobacteria bacterium]